MKQEWCYRDVPNCIRKKSGRMQDLWRRHARLQEIFQLWANQKPDPTHVFTTACAKGTRSWNPVALLIPPPDALQEPIFGGSEKELAAGHF